MSPKILIYLLNAIVTWLGFRHLIAILIGHDQCGELKQGQRLCHFLSLLILWVSCAFSLYEYSFWPLIVGVVFEYSIRKLIIWSGNRSGKKLPTESIRELIDKATIRLIEPPRSCMVEHFCEQSRCITAKNGLAVRESDDHIWVTIDGSTEKYERSNVWFTKELQGLIELEHANGKPAPEGHWSLSFQKDIARAQTGTKFFIDEATKDELKRWTDESSNPEEAKKILERLSQEHNPMSEKG